MPDTAITFEEGKPCPVKISGHGGGLSFSPNGDMLLVGAIASPTPEQIRAWQGKWRAKLFNDSEFPAIPMFGIGGEEWILEAPCNPAQQEKEAPGFCEALYAKDAPEMVAVLVDSDTNEIRKITRVALDEMFIERLVVSWNPYRHGDQYTKTFSDQQFSSRVQGIFKIRSPKQMWTTSW
jgi:hypothetical protein